MGSIPVGGLGKFFFRVIRLENASSLFSLYPSRHSIYHLNEPLINRFGGPLIVFSHGLSKNLFNWPRKLTNSAQLFTATYAFYTSLLTFLRTQSQSVRVEKSCETGNLPTF